MDEAFPMLKHLVFKHLLKAANLPTFLKFNNAKKCYFCKNHGWPQNWGGGTGAEAKLGAVRTRPESKTATGTITQYVNEKEITYLY